MIHSLWLYVQPEITKNRKFCFGPTYTPKCLSKIIQITIQVKTKDSKDKFPYMVVARLKNKHIIMHQNRYLAINNLKLNLLFYN